MSKKINFNQNGKKVLDTISNLASLDAKAENTALHFENKCKAILSEVANTLDLEAISKPELVKLATYNKLAPSESKTVVGALASLDTIDAERKQELAPITKSINDTCLGFVPQYVYIAYFKAVSFDSVSGMTTFRYAIKRWLESLGYTVPSEGAVDKFLDKVGLRVSGVTLSGKPKTALAFKKGLARDFIRFLTEVYKTVKIVDGQAVNVYDNALATKTA